MNNAVTSEVVLVGCDSTAVNTVTKGCVIGLLEEHLGRSLHWMFCQIHANELPLHFISNKISRLLAKYKITTVHIARKKNIHMLRSVKDNLGLNIPCVYRTPCECGKGKMGRSVETRCKEHRRHIVLNSLLSLR
jgi:hypothetical protein